MLEFFGAIISLVLLVVFFVQLFKIKNGVNEAVHLLRKIASQGEAQSHALVQPTQDQPAKAFKVRPLPEATDEDRKVVDAITRRSDGNLR
jgi:hypothetical protein